MDIFFYSHKQVEATRGLALHGHLSCILVLYSYIAIIAYNYRPILHCGNQVGHLYHRYYTPGRGKIVPRK